jgi:hypothetical protein
LHLVPPSKKAPDALINKGIQIRPNPPHAPLHDLAG